MSFRTQRRVDVELSSVANSLRECATASPRAQQAAVDVSVDDVEDEVVEIFFSKLSGQSLATLIARPCRKFMTIAIFWICLIGSSPSWPVDCAGFYSNRVYCAQIVGQLVLFFSLHTMIDPN
jgi:hypothetical protein